MHGGGTRNEGLSCTLAAVLPQLYFHSRTLAKSLHSISRKSVVVWSVSPGKPARRRLIVKLALMPTRAKHRQTSPYLILLEREYNMYFKAYYSIASRQPIFVLWVACSSVETHRKCTKNCCRLRRRTVRIFLPPPSYHGLCVACFMCFQLIGFMCGGRGLGQTNQIRVTRHSALMSLRIRA